MRVVETVSRYPLNAAATLLFGGMRWRLVEELAMRGSRSAWRCVSSLYIIALWSDQTALTPTANLILPKGSFWEL
jgi:hypothetical protein